MKREINDRQLEIIKYLHKSNDYVSAKKLATLCSVSLRTIRYDLEIIESYINRLNDDIRFLAIPNKGCKIYGSYPLYDQIKQETNDSDYFFLSFDERTWIILINLLFSKSNLTINTLSDNLHVSTKTLRNDIDEINKNVLSSLQTEIVAVQKKGIQFKPDSPLVKYRVFDYIITSNSRKVNYDFKKAGIFNENLFHQAYKLISFCKSINLNVYDEERLAHKLVYFLTTTISSSSRIQTDNKRYGEVLKYIEDNFFVTINNESDMILKQILYVETNIIDEIIYSYKEDNVYYSINKFVDSIIKNHHELADYRSELFFDLLFHINGQIVRKAAGLDISNPMAKEIQIEYFDLFVELKYLINEYLSDIGYDFNDDEIAFVLIYVYRYIKYTDQNKDTKVLVVCNTGVGTAKLLADRLVKTFNNIHVVMMQYSKGFKSDMSILNNIDYIISTVELGKCEKPVIVVSPFLNKKDVDKINNVINRNNTSNIIFEEKDNYSNTLHEIINNYGSENDELEKQLESFINHIQDQTPSFNDDSFFKITKILTEIIMLAEYYQQDSISKETYYRLNALNIHVILSIPRWIKGDFVASDSNSETKKKYPELYKMVEDKLKTISSILGVVIDSSEIVPIMNYII